MDRIENDDTLAELERNMQEMIKDREAIQRKNRFQIQNKRKKFLKKICNGYIEQEERKICLQLEEEQKQLQEKKRELLRKRRASFINFLIWKAQNTDIEQEECKVCLQLEEEQKRLQETKRELLRKRRASFINFIIWKAQNTA